MSCSEIEVGDGNDRQKVPRASKKNFLGRIGEAMGKYKRRALGRLRSTPIVLYCACSNETQFTSAPSALLPSSSKVTP